MCRSPAPALGPHSTNCKLANERHRGSPTHTSSFSNTGTRRSSSRRPRRGSVGASARSCTQSPRRFSSRAFSDTSSAAKDVRSVASKTRPQRILSEPPLSLHALELSVVPHLLAPAPRHERLPRAHHDHSPQLSLTIPGASRTVVPISRCRQRIPARTVRWDGRWARQRRGCRARV